MHGFTYRQWNNMETNTQALTVTDSQRHVMHLTSTSKPGINIYIHYWIICTLFWRLINYWSVQYERSNNYKLTDCILSGGQWPTLHFFKKRLNLYVFLSIFSWNLAWWNLHPLAVWQKSRMQQSQTLPPPWVGVQNWNQQMPDMPFWDERHVWSFMNLSLIL